MYPVIDIPHIQTVSWCSVAFVVFLRDEIDSLFSGKNPLLSLVIAFLILTPTLFVPMRHLSYGSLLGIVIALDILIVMIYDGVTKPTAPGSLIEPAVSSSK